MSKRLCESEVRNFILCAKDETLSTIRSAYEKEITIRKADRSLITFDNRATAIKQAEELLQVIQNIPVEDDVKFTQYSSYAEVLSNMGRVIDHLYGIRVQQIMPVGDEVQLLNEMEAKIQEARQEYDKLLALANAHTARESKQLLQDLGFDVSTIVYDNHVMVSAVDKSKLFICNNNK